MGRFNTLVTIPLVIFLDLKMTSHQFNKHSFLLRIPDSSDVKIAKICNLWTSGPGIQLINHLFKIQLGGISAHSFIALNGSPMLLSVHHFSLLLLGAFLSLAISSLLSRDLYGPLTELQAKMSTGCRFSLFLHHNY